MMNKVLLYVLCGLLLAFLGLGLYTLYQHSVISSQASEIDSLNTEVQSLEKQRAAREKVAVERKKEQLKIEKENKVLKGKLSESLKGNACNDAPLPDDTQRLLKELYSGRS